MTGRQTIVDIMIPLAIKHNRYNSEVDIQEAYYKPRFGTGISKKVSE